MGPIRGLNAGRDIEDEMRTASWLAVVAAAIGAAGCGKPQTDGKTAADSGGSTGSGDRKFVIAVIPKGTQHEFWRSIHAGANKAAKELGNVEVLWKGPATEDNREQQIQVVENFVNRGVDAMVLAPLDRTALVAPVELARGKGIPVIIIDSSIDLEDITSYVATNNYNGGALAAQHLGKVMNGKGNVVVLRYQVGSASTEQREAGFLDTMKKDFPQIAILSDELYSGADRTGALTKAENLLTRFGDKINGWFCPCEPVTHGTLQALRQQGFTGRIKVVGFDAGDEVVSALRSGDIEALILQDPVNMGYLGVKTAVEKLQGKEVKKEASTGENLLTKQNMDEPKYAELHSPDLSKWLEE